MWLWLANGEWLTAHVHNFVWRHHPNFTRAKFKKRKMTSDIGKHPKRRKKENINVTSGEMIDLGTFYLYTVRFYGTFLLFLICHF